MRLAVETLDADKSAHADASWSALQRLWNTSTFNSGGDRQTREQLHERR
ncbi:MAG TPA: hypothetical protein VLI90_00670 [Tepidisphaeraceae bacterium]|nr:hypothetical protein [Tepidisphaeraceae bacterium]